MAKFNVGDKVRLNENANDNYGYTQEGSEGVINAYLGDSEYEVKFHKFVNDKGNKATSGKTYEITTDCIDKISSEAEISYKPGTEVMLFVDELLKKKDELESTRAKWLSTFKLCVLPPNVRAGIDEAITTVLLAHKFKEWGIYDHFEKGLTNSILLYGPPGCGKTMVAESIAAVLDKNLMILSTGDIQSSMPGQTERNIQESFAKAKKKNAILLLDECDSVLSNRNNVGTIMASETNALLTEIERFDGVCILTTNRLHVLDPALQRRIIVRIKLEKPEKAARLMIWKNLCPPQMPLNADVDFDLLSEAPLAGGDIKNVILVAARKAIGQNSPDVKLEHFRLALQQEVDAQQEFDDATPRQVKFVGGMDKERTKGG